MSQRRKAFTLVEMLVVIAIIGMLMALLLPGIMAVRDYVRMVNCQKQLQDQVSAVMQYTLTKERFPGYADRWSISDGTPNGTTDITVGWVPQLFPYMDMEERLRQLQQNAVLTTGEPRWLEHVEFLTCPADPPDLEAKFWSLSACGGPAPMDVALIEFPLSYAVNAGKPDQTDDPADDPRTALFHDRTRNYKVKVTLEDITDGKRQTLVMTENVDLVNWASNTTTYGVHETHQGVVYIGSGGVAPPVPLNQGMIAPYDCDGDGLAENLLDYDHARPSSFHQEGFNVAYADGSVDFFVVDLAAGGGYSIYVSKMTPGLSD